ncbi:hypothetical protein BV898_01953 [Hypsibius exemplaris]|uniref:Uncharacterized protein n=1 Tax=Hypsibius exemplaris TaxID=2072580 RepID=A0A1W0XAW8_HYPEX|nr:hypothetical protein BV898_01953 [Hypsibius exemplaris]
MAIRLGFLIIAAALTIHLLPMVDSDDGTTGSMVFYINTNFTAFTTYYEQMGHWFYTGAGTAVATPFELQADPMMYAQRYVADEFCRNLDITKEPKIGDASTGFTFTPRDEIAKKSASCSPANAVAVTLTKGTLTEMVTVVTMIITAQPAMDGATLKKVIQHGNLWQQLTLDLWKIDAAGKGKWEKETIWLIETPIWMGTI